MLRYGALSDASPTDARVEASFTRMAGAATLGAAIGTAVLLGVHYTGVGQLEDEWEERHLESEPGIALLYLAYTFPVVGGVAGVAAAVPDEAYYLADVPVIASFALIGGLTGFVSTLLVPGNPVAARFLGVAVGSGVGAAAGYQAALHERQVHGSGIVVLRNGRWSVQSPSAWVAPDVSAGGVTILSARW